MLRKSILLNSGAWCIKLLIAALISVLLLLGADGVPFDSGNATADFFEWDAEDQKDGVYGYLDSSQPSWKRTGMASHSTPLKAYGCLAKGKRCSLTGSRKTR